MKNRGLLLLLAIFSFVVTAAKEYKVASPNGKIQTTVAVSDKITYSIQKEGSLLLAPSQVALELLSGKVLGVGSKLKSSRVTKHASTFEAPIFKRLVVEDNYNLLTLSFSEGFNLEFRAYNDGVVYRFVATNSALGNIKNEIAQFNFPTNSMAWAAYSNTPESATRERQFFNSFENTYDVKPIKSLNENRLITLPLLVESASHKLCITESDLMDYPGLFLTSSTTYPAFGAVLAPVVKSSVLGGHNDLQQIPTEREAYIAKVTQARNFPWRVIGIAANDAELAASDLAYRVAAPSKIADQSWIKPGKVAWDWWNDWNLKGVDFRAGINTETYKYYIDFASDKGIEYVILDEGWAVNKANDLFKVVPEIDLKGIVDYATAKNVGIILWAGYWSYYTNMEEVTRRYSEMGVKGFKIDFMDRDDQEMTNFLEETAELCAKYKMLVDFHGTCKPAGLQRTWPNVINFEGVNGLEQLKWKETDYDQVTYDLQIPFIRMYAGPMDYTQGAMRNVVQRNYYPSYSQPMSQGTRCRQLATYVIFDSPLNMLCDTPTAYMAEPESTDFIAAIPTVWNETLALDGKISEYLVMARQAGEVWYVGALTDWSERNLTLDLSFLGEGNYKLEIFQDGMNADRNAEDYKKVWMDVPADRKLAIKMMPGGGWVGKITKQ
ncbi:MAG: glycoside hydrolase family 97 protein [Phocaeicola sp.]